MSDAWILKVQEEVRRRLGAAYDVKLSNMRREDGMVMPSLILRKKGEPVYLTVEVPDRAMGFEGTIEEAADRILELFNKECPPNTGTWDLKKFSTMKQRVARRIISTKGNEKLLEEVPHIDFLDWSIVSYLYLTDEQKNPWSALIRWEHLRFWNVAEQQIWELAGENTPALLPAKIWHISEWEDFQSGKEKMGTRGEGLTGQDKTDGQDKMTEDIKKVLPLYLLSSEQGLYGASCILYDNLLLRFCEEQGYDSLLILPLSIHEVFLLPEENTFYAICLGNAVREGLYQETQREERLTDSIYRYDCHNDCLTIC